MRASLFRSVLSNWIGLVVAAIVGFFLSGFVARALGKELYGVWALAGAIASQLMVFDFGLRNALVTYLPKDRASGDLSRIKGRVASGALVMVVTALAGAILVGSIIPLAGHIFDLPDGVIAPFQIVLALLIADAAIEVATGSFEASCAAHERYDIINLITSSRIIISALAVVGVSLAGGGIVAIATTVFLVRLAQRIVMGISAGRLLPQGTFRCANVSVESARELISFGIKAFFLVLAARVIYQVDSVVVGGCVGVAAVGVYAAALLLVEQVRMFAQSASTVLSPRFSALFASSDTEGIKEIFSRWFTYSALLASFFGVPFLITGEPFLVLWMGEPFREGAKILQVLTFPIFFVFPAMAFTNYMLAANTHGVAAKIQMIEAGANLLLSVLLAYRFGAVGVALGTLIPAIVCRGIVLPYLALKDCGISGSVYVKLSFLKIAPLAIAYASLLLGLTRIVPIESWGGFLFVNIIAGGVFCLGAFVFYVTPGDKAYIRRRFQ